MSENYRKEVLTHLEAIESDFNVLLSLFKLLNADKITEIKQKILEHDLRRKVYDLCDGTLTVNQISDKLEQSPQNTTYHLGVLTSAGILSYRKEGREKYYFKTLE